jgi:selenocysteine-specific elongation factor
MRRIIVGTAGHIDHGKSTLVRALTGIDPDRLPEEKRRGITIELGFAHGPISDSMEAAFIDVPGHERFVRAMVAGAHGIDVVLFVVAADEGVMPQTREHADICCLLDVPRAVIALTKADLLPKLDPEWAGLVGDDIHRLGPLFERAPIVPVSASTGEGIESLRRALSNAAENLPCRRVSEPSFLPVDRVFSLRGHGTVVTGTLLAGALSSGESLDVVVPAFRTARVLTERRIRGLQTHGHSLERAEAGQRVAVNIAAEVTEIPRGSALMSAGTGAIRQGSLLDVELQVLADVPPVANRSRLALHLGTAQALATVDLLGSPELGPGSPAPAQLRLDRALPALRDQRFVLRGFRSLAHGGRTVAGGRVLLADTRRRRAADRALIETLRGDASAAATTLIHEAGARGVDPRWLVTALPRADLQKKDSGLTEAGGCLFSTEILKALRDQLAAIVRAQKSLPREEARTRLGPAVHPAAFSEAVAQLGPEFTVGDLLSVAVAPRDPRLERVEAALREGLLAPPTTAELAARIGLDRTVVANALRTLTREGRAVRLTDDLFVHASPAAEFRERALAGLRARGSLTMLDFKEMVGGSRKFVVPLCEWLDREHLTLRVGDKRVLRNREKEGA